ncbi:ATP-binding protein [Serratia sp. M24T3]|uniref:ATP-binding protein n=1 Tax=Serratia sp. M24T3 TaxID=932213 RepID=UPI00025B9C0B|nr:ATP-binding protein [Serratia sp. M24T3]EIC83838.1 virulence sensor protein BvgS [Serratia sp. M24T3]
MKLRFAVLLLALMPCLSHAEVNLRVAIDAVNPRYSEINTQIQNDDTQPSLISLLNENLKNSQLSLSPKNVAANLLKNSLLEQHKIDAFFVEGVVTEAAAGDVETQPLYSTHWRMLSLANRSPALEDDLNDLNDIRIVVVSDAPIQALRQRYPKITLIFSPSLSEAVSLLKAGAAEGVFCRQAAANVLNNNIFPGQLRVNNVDTLVTWTRLRLRNDDPATLATLNSAIQHLPQDEINKLLLRNYTVLTLMNIVPLLKQNHRNFDIAAVIVSVVSLFLISLLIGQIVLRRQSERRLKDGVKFWETLLNSLSTPVLVCNTAGIITHVNQALCKSLQSCRLSIVGIPVENLNQQFFSSPALETAGLVKASMNARPQFFEADFTLHQQPRSIAGWITPYSNTAMQPQGLVIGWYDMTERILLEQRLEQALGQAEISSHEKSEFLARMSHEIRSPMNVIMGVLEIESQRQISPQSPISLAYQASRGLLQIIGDVLDLSKIEAGEMLLKPTAVSLYELMESSAAAYQTLAEKKGLHLSTAIAELSEQHFLLDEGKMRQILNNLLSNAVKYTTSGSITLSAQISEPAILSARENFQKIIISIRDTGIGIDALLLPGIIKPYRQLSSSTPDSSGLGLTICHQLVSLMGGKMDIESQQGQGSTFSVILPLIPVIVEPVSIPPVTPAKVQKAYRVWIIDDLAANLLVMEMQLSALGHRVTSFDNAGAALEHLQQANPQVDLIFTDCQMPQLSGYQFAAKLRELEAETRRHIPLIGCTANAFSDEERKCLVAGMDAHLTKPLTQQDLAECIQNMLQNRQIDLKEVQALSAGKQDIIAQLISELINSSEQDLSLIEKAQDANNSAELKSRIHRLKGNFAITQFEAGLNTCLTLEQKLKQPFQGKDIESDLLRLRHTTRHFISLLEDFTLLS